jgi:MRG-binding protein
MANDSPKKGSTSPSKGEAPLRSIEWTAENEVHMFYAMKNRRPVGIERNFQMYLIADAFSERMKKEVKPQVLWNKLETLYDMETLNEHSSPPKILRKETEFSLPSEYDDLKSSKTGISEDDSTSKDSDESLPAPAPAATPTVQKSAKTESKPKSSTTKKKKAAGDAEEKEKEPKMEVKVEEKDKETPKQTKKRAAKTSESSTGKNQTPVTSTKKRRAKRDQDD